jgi:hypothetical protein
VRVFVVALLLLPLCLAASTFGAWLVTRVFLGHELWLVIDLLLGAFFGLPLFAFALRRAAARLRRPRIMENRRRVFE